jgi:hypothetical protein
MKHFLPITLLAAGCTAGGQQVTMPVTNAPTARTDVNSQLAVPASCPIYAPGDWDTDTPELPYSSPLAFGCVVDSSGATYGIATGDNSGSQLAIVPGNRELGIYYAFDESVTSSPLTSLIHAHAGADNVDGGPCCAEDDPNARAFVPQAVAIGPGGMLLSFGVLDATATQIEIDFDTDQMFPGQHFQLDQWNDRFYVNAAP